MSLPAVHRVPRELAAWIAAVVAAAGLSLSASLPVSATGFGDLRPGAIGAAVDTVGGLLSLSAAGAELPSMLRPHCHVVRVPDPRELAAVLRGIAASEPGASVSLGRVGQYPQKVRVISVCE